MALVARGYFDQPRLPGSIVSNSASSHHSKLGRQYCPTIPYSSDTPRSTAGGSSYSTFSRPHAQRSNTGTMSVSGYCYAASYTSSDYPLQQPPQFDPTGLLPQDWFQRSRDDRRKLRSSAYRQSSGTPLMDTNDAGYIYNNSPPLTPADSISQVSSNSSGHSKRSKRSGGSSPNKSRRGSGLQLGPAMEIGGYYGEDWENDGYGVDEMPVYVEEYVRYERTVVPDYARAARRSAGR